MDEAFSRKLRVLRAERALSLTEAAERVGVDRSTLRELERGERTPHDATIGKIARAYGIPVAELLEEEPVGAGKARAPEAGRGQEGGEPVLSPIVRRLRQRLWSVTNDQEREELFAEITMLWAGAARVYTEDGDLKPQFKDEPPAYQTKLVESFDMLHSMYLAVRDHYGMKSPPAEETEAEASQAVADLEAWRRRKAG